MKEKVKEFEISINFSVVSNMTIEAESEKEALRIAQKYYTEYIKDHIKDKENLNIKIKDMHTITPLEREVLEKDNIIESKKGKSCIVNPLPNIPAKKTDKPHQTDDIQSLRKLRDNLSVKIYTRKKLGKDYTELLKELDNIKIQIKNFKK